MYPGHHTRQGQLVTDNLHIVGLGAVCSGLFTLYYEHIFEKASRKGKLWTTKTEFRSLPMACVGGPCLTISLFWLGWSANKSVPWILPVLPGLFFGFGYQIIFISLLTYVTDAYTIHSASALAASTILRSIFGALLPLAASPMYDTLGNGWATSVLGFFSILCIPIPFFLYAGPWIRKRSKFCCQLLGQDELRAANISEN
jgi:MFS family permease